MNFFTWLFGGGSKPDGEIRVWQPQDTTPHPYYTGKPESEADVKLFTGKRFADVEGLTTCLRNSEARQHEFDKLTKEADYLARLEAENDERIEAMTRTRHEKYEPVEKPIEVPNWPVRIGGRHG